MASVFKRKKDRRNKKKPWLIAYTDENGKRHTITGTTDKAVTEQIARNLENKAALRRHGVTTAEADRLCKHAKSPIAEHITAYLGECRHEGQSQLHVTNKTNQLKRLVDHVKATRLMDIEPNGVAEFLQSLKRAGLSHRTVNQHRCTVVAFLNWCVEMKRLSSNPLQGKAVKRLDEREDRRRVRRALSPDELQWLVSVAPKRRMAYLAAYWTGLRRKELRSILWGDVDLDARVLIVRSTISKGKHDDEVPLHDELVLALTDHKPKGAKAGDNVFVTIPRVETVYRDLQRARDRWLDAANTEEDRRGREESDFLKKIDSQGRRVDFHSLRGTLSTHLARNKVTPQIHQRLMRHTDYRITQKHYTHLQLRDDTAAIDSLPGVGSAPVNGQTEPETFSALSARRSQHEASTGTDQHQPTEPIKFPQPSSQSTQVGYNAAVGNGKRLDAPACHEETTAYPEPEKTGAISSVG